MFLPAGPAWAQQKGTDGPVVINIVTVDKGRYAFIKQGDKSAVPVEVHVGQLVTWVNLSPSTHAPVCTVKGRDGEPLFALPDIAKKASASFRFTDKLFQAAGGKPGARVKLEYFCKNEPNTRGTLLLISPAPTIDKHIAEGHRAAQKGRWGDAVSAFENAERLATKNNDKPAQGHAALQQALHIAKWLGTPDSPADRAKLKKQELDAYRRAVDNLPPHTFDWEMSCNNLGRLHLQNGDFAEAIKQFEKVKDPASSSHGHILLTNLGEAYEGAKQLDKAYAKYLAALDIRPSADIAARKAFDLLLREKGLPPQEAHRLFKLMLRPGAPLVRMAGAEIPKILAKQDKPDIEPLLQYYVVARVSPASFKSSERGRLSTLATKENWAPLVNGVERIFQGKKLAEHRVFRNRTEVLTAFPGWESSLKPGGETAVVFSRLLGQVSDQFFEQSLPSKKLPNGDEAAQAALALTSAAYWVDPRNNQAALLQASILRLHHKTLDPDGRLLSAFATLLSARDNPLYEAAKGPADWQNLYAVHTILGEINSKNGRWGKPGLGDSAIGQFEQAAYVELVRLKARTNPVLQLDLAEAFNKGGFADRAAEHALMAADRLIDAGIRIETKKDIRAKIDNIVAASDARRIQDRWQELQQVNNNLGEVKDVLRLFSAYSPLAAGLESEGPGGLILVANLRELLGYDYRTGKLIEKREAWWKKTVRTLAISPVGGWVASGEKNEVTLGKGGRRPEVLTPSHNAPVQVLAFSGDGKRLAAADGQVVKVWDSVSAKLLGSIEVSDSKPPYRLALSADGSLVAFARGSEVTLWAARTGEIRGTLSGHKAPVTALAFGPGQVLATGDLTGNIRLWLTASAKPAETRPPSQPTPVRSLLFSPDGKMLLATGERNLYAANGTLLAKEEGPGIVRLYDVSTGREWARFRRENPVVPPVFTPDGRAVLLGGHVEPSGPGQVILWQVPAKSR
jgi:tetratricopeptide (TPR) repeat protein